MVKKYIKKAAKKGVKILKKKGGYSYTAKPKPKSKVKSTDTKTKKMQKEIRVINRKRKLLKDLGLEEYLKPDPINIPRYALNKKTGEYQLKPEFSKPKIKPKAKPKSLKSATGSKAVVQDISMSKLLNAQDKIRAAAKKAGQMVAIYRKNNPNNPNVKIYNQYMAKKKEKK